MNDSLLEWKSLGPSLARCWNQFFHSPIDLRVLRVLRISYAAIVLVNIATWFPYLELWFGEQGILPLAVSREVIDADSWTIFTLLPTDRWVLYVCYFCFLTQAVLLLVGILPRFQAFCVFVWLVSFQHRNIAICDGEDVVMRLVGFFVMLMPLHLLGKNGPASALHSSAVETGTGTARSWALRLLQVQMCFIFFDSALAKVSGNNWLDGTALYYVARLDDWFRPDVVPQILFNTPWIVRLMTWSVLAIEFAVPVLVWFRETRRWALVLAAVFHVACNWSMHLFLFQWIMMCGWCAFLTADDLNLAERWIRLAQTGLRSLVVRGKEPQNEEGLSNRR